MPSSISSTPVPSKFASPRIVSFALVLLTMIACSRFAPPALAQQQAQASSRDEEQFARMPWHLVDLWWDTGKDATFDSYSIDVTISEDLPPTTNLYIAPVGLGHLGESAFYGGIQTQSDGNTKADPRLRKIGPGFLMSMWGERSLDAIRPSEGGFCQSSGHEGDFVSVRRPYEWKKGKYTYRVVKMDKELVDGKPATWVGAFVYAHATDENIFIGALRFPGDNLVLKRQVASFVEVYGRRIPVADIPRVTVTFGNLQVNGEAVESPRVSAVYPKDVPDYADAKSEGDSVVIEVGQQVDNRTQRNVRLSGK